MRSNKGAVTLYVILAMLTISAFLMAIYIRNANAEKVQEQMTAQIKSTYENYNFTEVYETLKSSKPEIKGYSIDGNNLTIEIYTVNGINVDQNGKKILYYAVTTSNTQPTDEQWQNNNVIDVSSMGTTMYLWIKNENNIVSNEYKIILPESITISGETTVDIDGTTQLTATVAPDNVTNKTVTWSSSDEAIATVDNTGLVTGKTAGTVTITAIVDGKSQTYEVVVVEPTPTAVEFTINGTTYSAEPNTKWGLYINNMYVNCPDCGFMLSNLTCMDCMGTYQLTDSSGNIIDLNSYIISGDYFLK